MLEEEKVASMLEGVDVTDAVARIHDAIFRLSGHRVTVAGTSKLVASARWELALAVARAPDAVPGAILNLIAFTRLRESQPS